MTTASCGIMNDAMLPSPRKRKASGLEMAEISQTDSVDETMERAVKQDNNYRLLHSCLGHSLSVLFQQHVFHLPHILKYKVQK